MYEQFQHHFIEFEQKDANQEDLSLFKQLPQPLIHLFSELGGKSYGKGLYKIHNITLRCNYVN